MTKVIYGDNSFKQLTYRPTDNRLGTVTLPAGETITYDYDDGGQIKTQTKMKNSVVTDTVSYTPEGSVEKKMTDSTSTTTYHYDPRTNQLSSITYPNNSSIAYTYERLGRIWTLTERPTPMGTAYVTMYDYDAFGNLKWVKDPSGSVTTMTYDAVNRLEERTLPN